MARTVFVVGSSSGIGLAVVKQFFTGGWNIAAACRNPDAAKDLQELQSQDKKRLLLVPLELTKPETFQPAVDAAIKEYGGIDALVNNAGVNMMGAFEVAPPERLRKQFDINFFGPAEIARLVIPHLRASAKSSGKKSLIITIGSGSGQHGFPLFAPYTSSKHATEGLMESLYHELFPQEILVKIVIPVGGVKDTKLGVNSFGESDPLFISALMGQQPDLSGEAPEKREILTNYLDYTAKTMPKMWAVSDRAEGAPHAAQVAELAFKAAEDGTRKFRYFIGHEVVPLHEAKYGSRARDDEYMEKAQQFFV